jgi:hypothetical protein
MNPYVDLVAVLERIRAAVDRAEFDDAVRQGIELAAKYSGQEREWANYLLQDAIAERRQYGEYDG